MAKIVEYIEKHPKEVQRLVGLKPEQLNQLIKNLVNRHNQKLAEIEKQKTRIISGGGGRKPKLSLKEQIILTLVYLRHLTTFQLLGVQFGVSESTANDIFNYWFPLMRELLPSSILEQVKKNSSDYEIVKEILTEYELIVDTSEQNRERPGNYQEQEKYYSGKNKSHTFKNQFITLPSGRDIVDVVAGDPGPKSDINIFREQQRKFAAEQKFKGDLSYIGEASIATPHKKPKNKQLTPEQKQENKEFSAVRVFVEHVIRIVKIFRVAQERFRLKPDKYEQIILTICGLVRLRKAQLLL